ncbi:MAG: 30S ribosomal protein S12 methylthiotransferase RimO [Vicinamibacterales bacterium]
MKVGMISLGCPKNLVDSEVMLGLAQQGGHELTHDPGEAEVLIVNTCAFIDSAKQESIDTILEMARHKTDGSCKRLVVTGCMAERYRDELRKEIPEIDAVLGTGQVPEIVGAITGGATPLTFYRSSSRPLAPSSGPRGLGALPTYIYDADTPRLMATPKHYAYVKIAEGCDYKCAFCIIPTLRGEYRSRQGDSIVREARALAARGVKELLLISQDTTFYGVDRNERGALGRLLRELNGVDGLEWIRLLYLYPTTIDDGTLAAMAECEKVCNYIDLPLQHASNVVLKRMKRPGTRQSYDALLTRIRERVPGVALRTTFIVGFPGEIDADVDELCRFIGEHAFDHVGVFTYSHEEGTSAYQLNDDVAARSKSARRSRVMKLQEREVRRRHRARIGERVRVMVDGPSPDHDLVLRARLSTQAPEIDASVFLTDCDPSDYRAGDLVDGEIIAAKGYDLVVRPQHPART